MACGRRSASLAGATSTPPAGSSPRRRQLRRRRDHPAGASRRFPRRARLWGGARSAQASTPDSRETLERLLVQDPGALLVAEDEEGLGGTLIAAWDGWRGNMYRLAVRPELRRRGWGLALVRAGERRLHDLGAKRITALVGRGDEPAEAPGGRPAMTSTPRSAASSATSGLH